MLPGLSGISEMVVREEDLVSQTGGIGVDVLSTPKLIQLLEAAAIEAVKEFIPPDQMSLGTAVNVKHLSPTPRGMKIIAHALLKEVEKNRLVFLIDAHDEKEKVAEGKHERVLISKEEFLQRMARKRAE